MGHFINDRATLVSEAIDGLVAASGGALARLGADPDIRVVVRADWRKDGVAIVSGGGAGHEPAHAGLVGAGMLTAAVCGDVFASPSADAVLAAILAVTGEAGCLLIIKNYAGDRLNFGLAAERARAARLTVETVVVADDIAIADAPQPRGIAGTLFVHKIAGHAAAAGKPLAAVAAAARTAAASARSLGVALSTCTMPGQTATARLAEGEAELGLGIHGEPGFDTIALSHAADLVALLTERLGAALPEDGPIALLVNNLGSTTSLEMQVLTKALFATPLGRRARLLLGPAHAMTALDMHGVSISAIPLDAAIEAALLAETDAAGWPDARRVVEATVAAMPTGLDVSDEPAASRDEVVKARILAVCAALIGAEDELNGLDAKVGDGDTGSTFAVGAKAIRDHVDALPHAAPGALCGAISRRLSRAAGGSSGVLFSIFFAAVGAAVTDGADWADAMGRGIERMQFHGGAKAGDRTLLDALIPAAEALRSGALAEAAAAAERGAKATADMAKAGAGRASYLAEAALAGHPDPGAMAVAKAFAALAAA